MTDDGIQLILIQDPVQGKLIVCQVDNDRVTSGSARSLADVFESMGDSANNLSASAGKLLVGISGYDDDSRELYEIDEVRAFLRNLAEEVPWWFALLHTSLSLTWICCLVDKPIVHHRSGGQLLLKFDPPQVDNALQKAIASVAQKVDTLEMEGEDIETILQNLSITANEIMRGLNPAESDPFISKALREYHQQMAKQQEGQK
ncbi:hypothetical protein [Ralstonia pseudosolanacearum]|uniref:hypothetical protein n=1 Tax=Ralstonia pseudosolanacearum TaxID=1310165 RepID=UPI003CF345E6